MEDAGKKENRGKTAARGKKFCPRCGSTDIFYARGLPQLWSIWECRNCGYYGAFIVEDGATSEKIHEAWVKKHEADKKP